MSLRQKLLLLFSLTVAAAVAAVTWTVLVRVRNVFEQRDREETALVVSQFQREFQHRSADVAAAVDHVAASERVRTMAFELEQSGDAEAVQLALPAAALHPKTVTAGASTAESSGALQERVLVFERAEALRELELHGRNISQTARALGLERSHLYKKCQQLGIELRNQEERH